jgi:DNA repair exonuclease SbcCD ATPase subunit
VKITAYEVTAFKRIEHVRIEPGDRALLVIAGNNGHGKSSLLDGLTAAFGGARQTDAQPVRHGSDAAEIVVELDDGALVIRRRIRPDGQQQLEVYDESGKRRSPQAVLDTLMGARFLDPLAFRRLSPREQRDALLSCTSFPPGFSLARWEAERARVYDERRDLGRGRKQAEAELAGMAEPSEPEPGVEVDALVQRLEEINTELRERTDNRDQIAAIDREAEALDLDEARQLAIIEAAQQRLAAIEAARDEQREAREQAQAFATACPIAETEAEIALVKAELSAVGETNRRATEQAAARRRWEDACARAEAAREAHEDAERRLEVLELQKADALAKAETPLDEVDFDGDHVLLNGVPFQQASDAEQLRASLGIAMAMSPRVKDIWVKDGSLLDADSLELVREAADARGYRVWLERVGEGDAGALVIRDGGLVGADNEEAA